MRVSIITNHKLDAAKRLGGNYTPAESKTIDWTNSSDRRWMMNHLHHCMKNQKTVQLTPMDSN